MESNNCHVLKIDRGFRDLIRPLHNAEFLQLEANILSEGCKDPILTWRGAIVDGHNRYEICQKHNIPFTCNEMEFECREEVIAWICATQLKRRNITEETRKFLIGMQYESEKIVFKIKKEIALNLAETSDEDLLPLNEEKKTRYRTADHIAEENHISRGTVVKYANYTRALEEIGRKMPALVPKILSGRYKISHNNLQELSKLDEEALKKMARRIEQTQQPYIHYKETRREIQSRLACATRSDGLLPSVKDMPEYDPDAEITGLTLTVPSWTSSIDRIKSKTNLSIVSRSAKIKLTTVLLDLRSKITEILIAVMED